MGKWLIGTLILFLVSCGNGNEETDETEPQTSETIELDESESEENNSIEVEEETDNSEVEDNGEEPEVETESDETNDTDTLANMSDEERREHYLTLLAAPDNVDEQVFENLELRGVHENTAAYGGRVNPGSTIELNLQDRRRDIDSSDEVEVNEDGFFAIDLYQYENIEGDEISLTINHDELSQPQEFILEVHSVAEGMEIITPVSDTSAYEEELLESLDLEGIPTIYPNTIATRGYLDRHLEAFFYQIDGAEISDAFMVFSQRDNEEGEILFSLEDYPEERQPIHYYAVGDGVIVTIEEEVEEMTPEAEQAAETIQNETDFSAEEESMTTVPNADIDMWNPDLNIRTTLSSDENGDVDFPNFEDFHEEGTMLYLTIRDEDGYTETIEVEF